MSKHTPGPWTKIDKYYDNSGPINGADGKVVATIVSNSTRPAEEKLANARLIAAAPDLLVSLQGLLAALASFDPDTGKGARRVHGVANTARMAIEKATGEAS